MTNVLRVAGLSILTTAVVISTLAATPRTAHACSCGRLGLSAYADDVAVAFVGRQVSREAGSQTARMVFEVDRVYKGDVGPLIEVRSASYDAACGVDFAGQPSAGVAAFERDEGTLSVDLCSSIVTSHELEEVFGAGYPPDESSDLYAPGDGSTSVSAPLVTLLAVAAAVVLAVSILAVRRRRRRQSAAVAAGDQAADDQAFIDALSRDDA